MYRLSIKDQQKIAFSILEPYFNDFLFDQKSYQNITSSFVSRTSSVLNYIYFQFKNNGIPEFSLGICHFEIEEIMIHTGHPNVDYSRRVEKKDYSDGTIYDSQKIIEYDTNEKPTLTSERVEEYAHFIIKYMENYGWSFIQRYSYLPNVLAEMNRLREEGSYWHKIINGQADHFMRGLLIAKLCGDPQFVEKLNYIDSIFYDPKYNLSSWLPYYDQFRERLIKTEAKYSVKV